MHFPRVVRVAWLGAWPHTFTAEIVVQHLSRVDQTTPQPLPLASVCMSTSATGRDKSDRTNGTKAIATRSSRRTLGHNLARRWPHFLAKAYTAAKTDSANR